jgi:peptidoglycan/LPS O-acetylase OafA/YrhL
VLGAIIAVLVRGNRSILEKYAYPVTIVSGLLSVLVFIWARTVHMEYSLNYIINYTIVDIFFAGMIIMTLCSNELIQFKRLLNVRLMKELGVMSYCIYIFHHPIHELIVENYLAYFQGQTGSENMAKLICVGIALVITVPVVYALHKWVEVPMWKMKKYF